MNTGELPLSEKPLSAKPQQASSKRSSAYDRNFEDHLIDHKIYPETYEYGNTQAPEPGGLDDFHARLLQPRSSLSPSRFPDSSFRDFRSNNNRALNEDAIMRKVVPVIAGNSSIWNEQNMVFSRLESMTEDCTVACQPDFYDGANARQIDKQVRDDLGRYIIPTGHSKAPVAPNFFLEAKGHAGQLDVAKRQACYDGAVGARAMHELQSYDDVQPAFDGNAYTITSTYHPADGVLQLFASFPTQSSDGSPEYHMTQLESWAMTGNARSFRKGATAFRNAREWAQEQRDALIAAANDRAKSGAHQALSTVPNNQDESVDVSNTHFQAYSARSEGSADGYSNYPVQALPQGLYYNDRSLVQHDQPLAALATNEGPAYYGVQPTAWDSHAVDQQQPIATMQFNQDATYSSAGSGYVGAQPPELDSHPRVAQAMTATMQAREHTTTPDEPKSTRDRSKHKRRSSTTERTDAKSSRHHGHGRRRFKK